MEPIQSPTFGFGLLITGLLAVGGGLVLMGVRRRRALAAPAPHLASGTGAGAEAAGGGGGAGAEAAGGAKQLVVVDGYGGKTRLRADAAAALATLQEAARQAGFAAPLFLPVSGYRSRVQQEALYNRGLAKHGPERVGIYVARPGRSSHETGRAVDLHLGYGIDSDNEEKIKASAAYRWLAANAARFGWFPYEAEAWHWEFGAPHDRTGATYQAEISAGEKEGWLR